jgi:uncharacterized protein (DUF2147 family)
MRTLIALLSLSSSLMLAPAFAQQAPADAPKAAAPSAAPASAVAGVWVTIDDKTGKPRSEITISETGGVVNGRITKFLDPDAKADAVCDKCSDARKDKPIMNMMILTGLKKEGEEYVGGQILDPAEGKVYSAKVKLIEGGKKLEMRGFVGSPMFGRTQTWVRK